VCALGALIVSWCAVACAQERVRVLLLEPIAPTPLERELLTRLKGELGAAGIDVIPAPLEAGRDPSLAVASDGRELDVEAAFAAKEMKDSDPGSKAQPTLRLWLSDRVTGELFVEDGRELDGSLLASALAVQGFELLSARVDDWRWRSTAPAPAPPPPPPAVPEPPPPPTELGVGLQVGLLYDPPSGEAALTPMARITYMPGPLHSVSATLDLGVRLSVAGFGSDLVLEAADRHVDVTQSFALLEGIVAVDSRSWLSPYAAAGFGAYRVGVEGVGGTPSLGRSENTLSALGGAGGGLSLRPLQHWLGLVEAQALFALQPTAVEVGSTRAATLGRPLLVFTLGIGAVF
jgi:hypothetical protein